MVKQHITTAKTEDFTLEYYRTNITADIEATGNLYGILVRKCSGDHETEQADSGPITQDIAKADAIIMLLAANTVTPMTLYEVLDEADDLP